MKVGKFFASIKSREQLTLIIFLVLTACLAVAVFAVQQVQENRSHAMLIPGDGGGGGTTTVPSPGQACDSAGNPPRCVSGYECVATGASRAGICQAVGGGGGSSGGGSSGSTGGGAGANGGACVNGWTGTCRDHNNPGSCSGTWDEGHSPWPCPNGGNSIWCCVPKPPAAPAPVNKAPIANAGPDQTITLPKNSVTLTGSGTDDGTIVSYSWSGTGGTFSSANTAKTDVNGLTQGTYIFTLTVKDNGGLTDSATVTVKVNPAPLPAKLSLDLLLHGIGKAGDNVKQGAAGGGNMDPKNPHRTVTVTIYSGNMQKVKTIANVPVDFKAGSGSFTGEVDLGTDFVTGDYLVKVKFPVSLETQLGGIQHITAGSTLALPQTEFVTGDLNHDGSLDAVVLDYNILVNCFGTVLHPLTCSVDQRQDADLFDNGNVDQFDFNLFIREITNRN